MVLSGNEAAKTADGDGVLRSLRASPARQSLRAFAKRRKVNQIPWLVLPAHIFKIICRVPKTVNLGSEYRRSGMDEIVCRSPIPLSRRRLRCGRLCRWRAVHPSKNTWKKHSRTARRRWPTDTQPARRRDKGSISRITRSVNRLAISGGCPVVYAWP
jgi:hypothetical protein